MPMIPLKRAMLCVNCELISDTERDCPRCGSKQMMSVMRIAGGSLYRRVRLMDGVDEIGKPLALNNENMRMDQ